VRTNNHTNQNKDQTVGNKMKKYWVVFNPETGKFENYTTRGEADIIAKALAVAQPTFEFVIFEAVASIKPKPASEEGVVMTDKEKIAQLEASLNSVEAELVFAEQARDQAAERATKAEDKLEAIKQAVGG
jgi:chromosome segregation ATPase